MERISTTDDDAGEFLPSRLARDEDGSGREVLSIDEFSTRISEAADRGRLLLIFDQFEELVTLFDDAGDAREHPTNSPTQSEAQADVVTKSDVQRNVVTLLLRLLQGRLPHPDDLEADDSGGAAGLPPLPVKILLSFRDDYLGRVRELLAARPELIDQALRVAPPAAEALPTIISGPFERYPGDFAHPSSPVLARRLVDIMSKQFGSGDLGLSEVQTVCLRLWQSDDPDALLTAKGPQGLLEDYLGEAIETMPANLQPAAIQILSEMATTSAGTRQRHLRERPPQPSASAGRRHQRANASRRARTPE